MSTITDSEEHSEATHKANTHGFERDCAATALMLARRAFRYEPGDLDSERHHTLDLQLVTMLKGPVVGR